MGKRHYIFVSFFVFSFLSFSAKCDEVGFKYKIQEEEEINLNRFFYAVMQGEAIAITVETDKPENIEVAVTNGKVFSRGSGKWEFKAPEVSGKYELNIRDVILNQTAVITIFVLIPGTKMKGEYLNGYRIGNYPLGKYKGKNNYKKPVGFIEVTENNKDVYITPHFQLKQFLCKQSSEWPKYLVLNPKLLLKLEYLISELSKKGINVKTFFIMSGYRTPYYNKLIGNVEYSRHVFGDAADIYIDENHNGVIDDLNSDGKNNMSDAEVLYSIVQRLDENPDYDDLLGGLGKYKKNSAHTCFIHVDTRGYKARW